MQFPVFFVVALINFGTLSHSGVPLSRHEQLKSKNERELGLYDANDKVISVTNKNMASLVHNRKYATLLEFYNSFCGHCRNFAPKYKQLAEDVWPWRDVVKVMALDCADEENGDICRDYEVMAYPTLRYFPTYYENTKNNTGYDINTQDLDLIKAAIVKYATNEKKVDDSWPNFSSITDVDKSHLLRDLPENVHYILIIFEPENSTLAGEMILEFNRVHAIRIRRTTSAQVAASFGLDKYIDIAVLDRNSNVEKLTATTADRKGFKDALKKFLNDKNISEIPSTDDTTTTEAHFVEEDLKNKAILEEVKKHRTTVYVADLEKALRYTIFHEITKFSKIVGERLLALQQYISVVRRYNPLGERGQKFLQDVEDFIMSHNQEIKGEELEDKLKQLEAQHSPIFSSSRWIGCQPSKRGFRGFTCGLWQLFHFMTVQAAENEKSSDPLEVLRAIHGFVTYFFGCTKCSNHFQEMAIRRKIWDTTSKDNAVLWLWSAHNEVNQRLAGDSTEDPEFPKVQFPTKEYCKECYSDSANTPNSKNGINWNESQVLSFLNRIYSPNNISRFGVENETLLPPSAEKLREKRMVSNVFSDMDMRMGIFLYVFCIGMMVVAVKLFLYKGYRKKIYAHDFLGKV